MATGNILARDRVRESDWTESGDRLSNYKISMLVFSDMRKIAVSTIKVLGSKDRLVPCQDMPRLHYEHMVKLE